jgi:hypothetical protein
VTLLVIARYGKLHNTALHEVHGQSVAGSFGAHVPLRALRVYAAGCYAKCLRWFGLVIGLRSPVVPPYAPPTAALVARKGHGTFLCSASVALRRSRHCGCCSPPPTHLSRASRFGLLVALPPPHGGSLYRRPSEPLWLVAMSSFAKSPCG